MSNRIRTLFEDAGCRGWLHAIRLDPPDTPRPTPASGRPPTATLSSQPTSGPPPTSKPHPASSSARDADPRREVDVDGGAVVPMASVYKLPLVAAFCRLVDEGKLDPREQVRLEPSDRTAGPTGLSILADPVTMSLRDLATTMMAVSDNASADALLDVVGLERLAAVLHDAGLTHTRVRRGAAGELVELQRRTGASDPDAALAVLADNDRTDPAGVYDAANASASTARDLTRLLRLIWSGKLLSEEQTGFVQRAMARQVFAHRLAAGFPHDGVKVFGKTGTFGALRHEAGVVVLPGGDAFAIAVFTLAARGDRRLPRVDAAIGQAARLAVDTLR